MKRILYLSLILIYLFPNFCFGKHNDEPQISLKIVRLLGVPSNDIMNYYESYYNKENEPSWCTTAICIGFTIMGVAYILAQFSELFSELPKEITCGCCTGIILGVIFAYLVPFDKVASPI